MSSGTGAATFIELGLPVIDTGLPEHSPAAELTVAAGRLTGWLNPDLVVSHEDFAVMPAAKIFHKATVFLTDWFTSPDMYSMNTLKFADEILFLGRKGVFVEPAWVCGKVRYLGPVFRPFSYGLADRARARDELGLPPEAVIVGVFPGSWREERTPISGIVLDAMRLMPGTFLLWVAGDDYGLLRDKVGSRDGVMVLERDYRIERLMAASNVAITKANRQTALELNHLGLPSIALSFGLNPIDDAIVRGIEGCVLLDAGETTPERLADVIAGRLRAPAPTPMFPESDTAAACARYLRAAAERTKPPPDADPAGR
ncbi:MAG: hypothetical protein IT165_38010 [Bryobacterales bacterium]|nr:hypothetical protein [Bryobacterales bacterium]